MVALCPSEQNIHPDPHRLGAGRHEVVGSLIGLHAEGHPLADRLAGLVVHVHLGDRVEVDTTFYLALQ